MSKDDCAPPITKVNNLDKINDWQCWYDALASRVDELINPHTLHYWLQDLKSLYEVVVQKVDGLKESNCQHESAKDLHNSYDELDRGIDELKQIHRQTFSTDVVRLKSDDWGHLLSKIENSDKLIDLCKPNDFLARNLNDIQGLIKANSSKDINDLHRSYASLTRKFSELQKTMKAKTSSDESIFQVHTELTQLSRKLDHSDNPFEACRASSDSQLNKARSTAPLSSVVHTDH